MPQNTNSYRVSGANIHVGHSAHQPPQARNAPHVTVRISAPPPAQQYQEVWRTRYYGDTFMRERVLVPVNAAGEEDHGIAAALRGLISWLFSGE